MENKRINIVYKKVDDLIPYDNNPRNNDEAVDYVAKSIEEFGFKVPCVVSGDGVLITGHTRLKACKKLGIEEVPCIVADDLTPEQMKAFRLADNKTSEFAEWDLDKLDIELGEIADIDMGDVGFDVDIEDQGFDDEKTPEDKDVCIDDEKALVVDCENENEMEKTFETLTKEGYKCRIITL